MKKALTLCTFLLVTSACTTTSNPLTTPPESTVQPTQEPSHSPETTPSPSLISIPQPTPVQTKSTLIPSKTAAPKAAIRAEPASIKATAKRAELGNLPAFHLYFPGSHKVIIQLKEGTGAITAQFFPYNKYPVEIVDMQDTAIVKILMRSSFGRGIPTGINKETILIKNMDNTNYSEYFSAPILVSVPVEINLLD